MMVIRPSGGWRALDLRELWAYRKVLYFLVWREVRRGNIGALTGSAAGVLESFRRRSRPDRP